MKTMLYPRRTFRGVSRIVPLAVVGLALAACEAGAPLISPESTVAASAKAGDPGQRLARALAGAMGKAQVRAHLVNALRNSPFKENKVVLGEFAQTPQGRQVLRAAAASAGVDVSTLEGWVAALPPMDLYVPVAVHRREWAGTDAVVVGLNMDTDDPTLTGYRPDGSTVQLDARNGTPSVAVVLMHPAEPKSLRAAAKAAGTGRTIEDPTTAEYDDPCIYPTATGGMTVQAVCGGGVGGDPGGGGSTGYNGAEIHRFLNYEGDGWGEVELMVKTYTAVGGTRKDEQVMSGNESTCVVPGNSTLTCYSNYKYPHRNVVMGNYIKVWERDSGVEWGGDDYWGDATFNGYGVLHKFFPACSIAAGYTQAQCDNNGAEVYVQIYFAYITNGAHDDSWY